MALKKLGQKRKQNSKTDSLKDCLFLACSQKKCAFFWKTHLELFHLCIESDINFFCKTEKFQLNIDNCIHISEI